MVNSLPWFTSWPPLSPRPFPIPLPPVISGLDPRAFPLKIEVVHTQKNCPGIASVVPGLCLFACLASYCQLGSTEYAQPGSTSFLICACWVASHTSGLAGYTSSVLRAPWFSRFGWPKCGNLETCGGKMNARALELSVYTGQNGQTESDLSLRDIERQNIEFFTPTSWAA